MIKHEQPTNDIRKKEEEVARWKATVAPQTEYLCETMDKLDFSSALSASVAVVKSMGEYNTNRISYEVYAVIKDMEFDEKIIPYRINIALNMDVINAQPYKAAYMQNIVDAIRMVFNNHMKNKVTFAKIEKRRGISAYFRYVKEAISVTSQIIRQGHYKDTAGDFKIVVKKKILLNSL